MFLSIKLILFESRIYQTPYQEIKIEKLLKFIQSARPTNSVGPWKGLEIVTFFFQQIEIQHHINVRFFKDICKSLCKKKNFPISKIVIKKNKYNTVHKNKNSLWFHVSLAEKLTGSFVKGQSDTQLLLTAIVVTRFYLIYGTLSGHMNSRIKWVWK